jgi:hypothetical protein
MRSRKFTLRFNTLVVNEPAKYTLLPLIPERIGCYDERKTKMTDCECVRFLAATTVLLRPRFREVR